MLIDMRTYTCRPGMLPKQLKLYETFGKTPQTRHLGQPIAWLTTETGNVNQFVHLWAYKDAGDREKRRAAMEADADWQIFKQKSSELGALVTQENKLMKPADFFGNPRSSDVE
ncbi:MAG: NIPSNAP family protein [Hyphomicrobiales bacterium]